MKHSIKLFTNNNQEPQSLESQAKSPQSVGPPVFSPGDRPAQELIIPEIQFSMKSQSMKSMGESLFSPKKKYDIYSVNSSKRLLGQKQIRIVLTLTIYFNIFLKRQRRRQYLNKSQENNYKITCPLNEHQLLIFNDKVNQFVQKEVEDDIIQKSFDKQFSQNKASLKARQKILRQQSAINHHKRKRYSSIQLFQFKLTKFKGWVLMMFQGDSDHPDKENKRNYVIESDSNVKIAWDFLCMLLIFYEIIAIPFRISFNTDISTGFDQFVNIAFYTDILLTFNTSIYVNGMPVYKRKTIAIEYLKLWFWLDLLASFPYMEFITLILENQNSEESGQSADQIAQGAQILRLLKFFRFIKIVRLLRLAKLKVIFDKINEFLQLSPTIAAIFSFFELSVLILQIFWSHWLGCIFHYVATQEDPDDNWLYINGIYDQSWQVKYINSLYWGVTTMNTVGYGDLSPQTPLERLFGVLFLVVASFVFSYTMNTIGNALQQIKEKKTEYLKKISDINKFMKKTKIPVDLQNRVRQYFAYVWENDCQENLIHISSNLSQSLRLELTSEVNGLILNQYQLFPKLFSKPFLAAVVISLFKESTVLPYEVIFEEEEPIYSPKHLYFIVGGYVNIYMKRNNQKIAKLIKQDYFGEIAFFSDQERTASAQSGVCFTNLYYIDRKMFTQLLNNYPEDLVISKQNIILYFKFRKNSAKFEIIYFLKGTQRIWVSYVLLVIWITTQLETVQMFILQQIRIYFLEQDKSQYQFYNFNYKRCIKNTMKQFVRTDILMFHTFRDLNEIQEQAEKIQELISHKEKEMESCNLTEQEQSEEDKYSKQLLQVKRKQHINFRSMFAKDKKKFKQLKLEIQKQEDQQKEIRKTLKKNSINLAGFNFIVVNQDISSNVSPQKMQKSLLDRQFSMDSEEEEEKIQGKINETVFNYLVRQKDKYLDLNKNNEEIEKRDLFSVLPYLDKGANFTFYDIHNNLSFAMSEAEQFFKFGIEAKPRIDTEYDDDVFNIFLDHFQLDVKNLLDFQDIKKANLKQHINFTNYIRNTQKRQQKKNDMNKWYLNTKKKHKNKEDFKEGIKKIIKLRKEFKMDSQRKIQINKKKQKIPVKVLQLDAERGLLKAGSLNSPRQLSPASMQQNQYSPLSGNQFYQNSGVFQKESHFKFQSQF